MINVINVINVIKAKKEIDLLSYLPNFLREFDELKAALDAENPEFILLWEHSEEMLRNGFILTADEWGIKNSKGFSGYFPSRGLTSRQGGR